MKLRFEPVSRVTTPLKLAIQRVSLFLLVALAFGLMMLGKADTVLVERLRTHVSDAAAPVLDALSRPAATVSAAVARVQEWRRLLDENERLREENSRLMRWQVVARRLEAEARIYRRLLAVVPNPDTAFITARVIADTGGAFARSLLINEGSREGVGKGNAVMTQDGLVGRVAEVGKRAARVLLITDLNSRVPVVLADSRARTILVGDNSRRPRLEFLPEGIEVQPGERVTTSGHAGAFPPGLPVGQVASITDGGVRVQPFVSTDRLEYVRVLDFRLSGILGADDGVGQAGGGTQR